MAIPSVAPHRALEMRQLMKTFINERLQLKLDKLAPDEQDKRSQLVETHRLDSWLADAARRVVQIQIASHTLKQTHPDARGTSLHVEQRALDAPGLVGTHSLSTRRAHDVVGNAAALDVFKFLSLEHEGKSLLQLAIVDDVSLRAAFSDDPNQARSWQLAFAGITANKTESSSHTLAKQIYFPLPNGGYHLLGPLFPTTLVHRSHQTIREDRFGEEAKAAREARRKGDNWPTGYREYPDLVIQKFGGTKPQNISQLNSERYGENWLLPSLPPSWHSTDVKPPLNADSIFDGEFRHRKLVRDAIENLRRFIAITEHNNLAIRQERTRLVANICDETHQYAAQLHSLPAGWSADPACRLHDSEQLWLDPQRASDDDEFMKRRQWGDWPLQVSKRFANWLNSAIESKQVRFGEAEAAHWSDVLNKELSMFTEVLEDDRE